MPTLEGEAELDVRPGHAAGEVRVLRGRGLPVLQGFGRGGQRVLVNVAVPRRLTRRAARGCWRSSSGMSSDETYEHGEGFLDKLKSAFR